MQTTETGTNLQPSLIVGKYFDMVYRLARKTAGADKADDATQNVFMRYMRHYSEFESEEHIKAWLIRVTYNCSMSELKNTWTERTTALPENENGEIVLEAAEPSTPDLSEALGLLPPKYRSMIHMYYYEQLSTKEIAQATNTRESTVRSLLHRGRQRLKTILKEEQIL